MGKKIYSLILIIGCLILPLFSFAGCNGKTNNDKSQSLSINHKMQLDYATEFSVDFYDDGYAHVHIEDGCDYVLVPKGQEEKNLGYEDATVIFYPCENIYLAATSAMDQFRALNALNAVKTCSTTSSDYAMESVRNMIDSGKIKYVGKYKAPDYEALLNLKTDIAIESTMIYHAPKIKEELERLGIPVLVERSSYEKDPFGRVEWIKLYGLLSGHEEEALKCYEEQIKQVEYVINSQDELKEKKTVVFFYVTSNGYVNVRKPGDYISKMIEIAGGEYALKSLQIEEENALSTVNISWEDFYYYAKDADLLIYNGTIDGGLKTYHELLSENEMFNDFKAVNNKNVYCSTNNMFQESSRLGDILVELRKVLINDNSDLQFFIPLKDEM